MTAPRIRSDYDELQHIEHMFAEQAEAAGRMIHRIKEQIETLRGGDWFGDGAQQFYKEMEGQVLPALGRLQGALAEAALVTRQIAAVMHQAEQDASRCFQAGLKALEKARDDLGAEAMKTLQAGVSDMGKMETMISNLMKAYHDAQMSIISNLKQ